MMPKNGENSFASGDAFRLIVESVKDYAIFMLDPQGYITSWNRGAELIKGYQASEIIGSHFSKFYTPADITRKHPQEEIEIAGRLGSFEEEGWRVKKDGSKFWASVVITRVNDQNGVLVGFAKVTRDLTERRLAEQVRLEEQRNAAILEQVKEREQTLDQIFSQSPSFMVLLSVPDFRFLRTNSEYLRLIGKSGIIGKRVIEVEPELESQGLIELLNEVVRTGKAFVAKEKEIHYAPVDGLPAKTVYLDFVYQPLRRANGEIYAIAAQGNEVTEKVLSRKSVENERENFRNLFKQTPEMVCVLRGPEHTFEFVNDAHIKLLGFAATGMTVREAQPESIEVHGILDEVYRTGKTAELKEITVTLSKRQRVFNLTYAARRDEAGEISGVMILGVEVTAIVQSRKRMQETLASRDEFFSVASHELKTPITNLKFQIQLFEREGKKGSKELLSSPRVVEKMGMMDRSVRRLTSLIEDLLDVTRMRSGKMRFEFDNMELKSSVMELVSRFQEEAWAQGLTIEPRLNHEITGHWDRLRIEQVVANLLSNAIRYGKSPTGESKPIEVVLEDHGDKAKMIIQDHGVGIAEADYDRIFGQFEQAISSRSAGGLGLGLFISKQIVESHGGKIWVESNLGQGSKFSVELPKMVPADLRGE